MALTLGISGNYIAMGVELVVFTVLFYPVSGAQFNPAISICLLIKNRMRPLQTMGYVGSQFLGVFCAVLLFYFMVGRTYVLMPQQNINILKPLAIEILFSFIVVLAYLKMKKASVEGFLSPDKFFFLPGSALLVAGLAGASLSGGAFNPAIGLGPVLAEIFIKSGYPLSHCWIYGLGPLIGGIAAVITDTYIYAEKKMDHGA
jgi:aquaporin Z